MYKMTIQVPGGVMEVPGDSLEAVIKAASFLQNLPTVCPVDGTPTRLNYRKAGGFEYFGLVSTGSPQYTYPFGRPLEKGDEFFEGKFVKQGKEGETRRQWCYYDHSKQEQIVVWEDGKLLVNVQRGGKSTDKEAIAPSPSDDRAPWDGGSLGIDDPAVSYATQQLGATVQPSGYISPIIQLRKDVALLGNHLYGDNWYTVCKNNVGRMTNGKYTELEDLTAEELTRMLAGLNQLKTKAKVGA